MALVVSELRRSPRLLLRLPDLQAASPPWRLVASVLSSLLSGRPSSLEV